MLKRYALSRSLEPVEESKERNGGTELVDERLLANKLQNFARVWRGQVLFKVQFG